MGEPDWRAVEERLGCEIKPIKSRWFNGNMAGASSKREVVSTMAGIMRHWWHLQKDDLRRTVKEVLVAIGMPGVDS